MPIKTKRLIAMLTLICVVSIFILSALFIISHNDHDCIGEHCPICLQIHNSSNLLNNFISSVKLAAFGMLSLLILLCTAYFATHLSVLQNGTLIEKKIRLNI